MAWPGLYRGSILFDARGGYWATQEVQASRVEARSCGMLFAGHLGTMDPVTHFLTGACIGRAGFNRKSAYATLAAVLAAEAADMDILWGFAGPVEELKHHRGITHTFIAVPVIAAVVVGAVWLIDRIRRRWRIRKGRAKPQKSTAELQDAKAPPAPAPAQLISWGWLYLTALVAALSHLLLDWTNNYGLRPFFPFNPRWYAGSFVFIIEPVIWGLFALALIMPWLFGLADQEMGARRARFRGRGWAIFALCGIIALWGWRWFEHEQALAMLFKAEVTRDPVIRIALEPYPVNPYHWQAILETLDYYQTAEINTFNPDSPVGVTSDPEQNVIYKPADTPAVEAAKQTLLGRVYLDWGQWAVVRDVGPEPEPGVAPPNLPFNRKWTTVEFSDLRFSNSSLGTGPGQKSPLSGWVYIVDGRDEAAEGMGSREQETSGRE
jgi:inner membrane protein